MTASTGWLNPILTLKWQQQNGYKPYFSLFWVGCPPHALGPCRGLPMLCVSVWGDPDAVPRTGGAPGEGDHPRAWSLYFGHVVFLQYRNVIPSEEGCSFMECGSLKILIRYPQTFTWFVETLSPQEVRGCGKSPPLIHGLTFNNSTSLQNINGNILNCSKLFLYGNNVKCKQHKTATKFMTCLKS